MKLGYGKYEREYLSAGEDDDTGTPILVNGYICEECVGCGTVDSRNPQGFKLCGACGGFGVRGHAD